MVGLAIVLLMLPAGVSSKEPIEPLSAPEDLNFAKVALGKRLFEDTRLSQNQNISCSTCHLLEKAGADGLAQSIGTHGESTSRNTPTIFNVSLNVVLFWDGRANTLKEQIEAVIKNPVEMDGDWDNIINLLKQDNQLATKMKQIYDPAISQESVTDALAEYLRSLVTVDSPFDRYLLGDANAISADAKTGYEKFKSHGCVSCHQGRNVGGNLFQKAGLMTEAAKRSGAADVFAEDLGRYEVTGRERDKFVFRVPSLRNVALTAPYFHNGSVDDLDEAIRIMAIYQLGKSIPESDVGYIRDFLISLNGSPSEQLP